jgi:hypothetical protein
MVSFGWAIVRLANFTSLGNRWLRHSSVNRGERWRSSSIRFDASAFESVSSNSSPVSRHSVSR